MERELSRGASQQRHSFLNRAKLPLRKQSSPKPTFHYIRGELIGMGSYGRVYLGLNAKTGEVMAIKQVELTPSAIDRSISRRQRDIIDALKLENDMLKDLNHAHIVQYLGYEETDQCLSIFLEYVPGGTIKSCINKYGRFRDDVTKSLTSQILSGLKYLHCKGVIHRDLKADNILLEPSGICKISDFGISKKVEDLHNIRAFTNMKGTVQWMAPEMLDSKKAGYDAKIDIWSVGCVVLEMWSGQKPWNGENIVSIMYKLSQYREAPPVPADLELNPLANNFRLRCFQANPQDRPSAAELQAHSYLALPLGWTFPYVLYERNVEWPKMRFQPGTSADKGPTHVPTLRSVREDSTVDAEGPRTLRPLKMGDANLVDDARTERPVIQDNGPPIVVITPPGSPKDRSFAYDELELSTKSSDTSEGTRSSKHRRGKALVVVNPDNDSDSDGSRHALRMNQFVYTPPPLPETSFSLAKQLAPSRPPISMHRRCFTEGSLHGQYWHQSTSFPQSSLMSLSPPASGSSSSTSYSSPSDRLCSNTSTRKGETGYSDDSDTDDDLHLWNKPPADLRGRSNRQNLTCASTPVLAQTTSGSQVTAEDTSPASGHVNKESRKSKRVKTTSWLTRPDVEDVYDHLQRFFPDHDVGQTLAQPRLSGPTPVNANTTVAAVMHNTNTGLKSVRQQVDKSNSNFGQLRRMTKFWVGNTEEGQRT
ncbi:hypothetical protein AX15_001764 [Amanita polypyramis BW_CC]|nr:hypothetical protein AX15_001764 [Amanita polypyramis BW_CC]